MVCQAANPELPGSWKSSSTKMATAASYRNHRSPLGGRGMFIPFPPGKAPPPTMGLFKSSLTMLLVETGATPCHVSKPNMRVQNTSARATTSPTLLPGLLLPPPSSAFPTPAPKSYSAGLQYHQGWRNGGSSLALRLCTTGTGPVQCFGPWQWRNIFMPPEPAVVPTSGMGLK